MYGNPLNPYWWIPTPALHSETRIRRVDVGGIFELTTNAVQLSEASVDYGINPICFNALPCESVVLLKVHADAPVGGERLPVTVVTPNSGQSTVSSGASSSGTKVPVVDSNNNPVTGNDITGSTERLAYINKRTGIVRFLEFTAGVALTPTDANVQAAAAKK